MSHPFFRNKGPFSISDILKFLDIKNYNPNKDIQINDIKDLNSSTNLDISFLHSKKYK